MKTLYLVGLLLTTTFAIAQTADQKAIKAVIERETKAYYAADARIWRDCWANVPEAHSLNYSAMTGKVTQNPMPASIEKTLADLKPVGMKIETSNEQMRVNGHTAFVQYDQHLTREDGAENFSHQTRYLEKLNGSWKIIHMGSISYRFVPPPK